MFRQKAPISLAIVLTTLSLAACEKKTATSNEPARSATAETTSAPPTAAKTVALSDDARQKLEQVLAAYESVRAQLARDEIGATTASAEALEKAARDAGSNAPERLRSHLSRLGTAAGQLKQMPKSDAAEVRRAFGQVSEALVGLLSAEPPLRGGKHLFECPMAQGYKKWVQPNEQISNPYMGTKMLECGSAAKWEGT